MARRCIVLPMNIPCQHVPRYCVTHFFLNIEKRDMPLKAAGSLERSAFQYLLDALNLVLFSIVESSMQDEREYELSISTNRLNPSKKRHCNLYLNRGGQVMTNGRNCGTN